MPAPSTSAEFLDLVRKSGLVDEARFKAWLQKTRAAATAPPKPITLADNLVRDGLLTQFQAESILQGKWKRFTIGPYRVLDRIGSGNMGSVYLCEDQRLNVVLAVKVLPTAVANDAVRKQRFEREARCQAAVRHDNVARVRFVDKVEGLVFIGMEYVYGSSLRQMVDDHGRLDVCRAGHYIRQAALGLLHVHMQGIIHRDIEPANILVDHTGTVKIIDFGLARAVDDQSLPTNENRLVTEFLGPGYLAPECAASSAADQRADVYSLGAVFYFCLAGRPPVPGGTVQMLRWLQVSRPEPISSLRPDVPEALAAVLERMMARDPPQRYPNMQAVADALAPWTKRPIPPPAEHELPRWSPAAMEAIRRSLNLKHRGQNPTSNSPCTNGQSCRPGCLAGSWRASSAGWASASPWNSS